MKSREVILFQTHVYNEKIYKEARNIQSRTRGCADVVILLDETNQETSHMWEGFEVVSFTESNLKGMGFPFLSDGLFPGSVHFALIYFSRLYPDYAYYWLVENDVRYTGDWASFFSGWQKEEDDLLACHLRMYSEEPDWFWWDSRRHNISVDSTLWMRCFMPIYRISAPAIKFVDKCHQDGWMGHCEIIQPTLLYSNGFSVRDMGGSGSFVRKGDKNRAYIDFRDDGNRLFNYFSTMRWRPVFKRPGLRKNKLYHPVK